MLCQGATLGGCRDGWVWVGRPKHSGVVLLVRGWHHYGWLKWRGAHSRRGSGDAQNVGVVHLLHWGVWNMVGPHQVLEVEGRLQDELLRDALSTEAGGQVWKGARGNHHQTLCPHSLYHLRDQVRVGWRLSHRPLSILLQHESPQLCDFVPH